MVVHREMMGASVHTPFTWVYADEAARLAATGFQAYQVGKVARQASDNSMWVLTDVAPTWAALGLSATERAAFHAPHSDDQDLSGYALKTELVTTEERAAFHAPHSDDQDLSGYALKTELVTTEERAAFHAPHSDDQDLSGYALKTELVTTEERAAFHAPHSDDQDLSSLQPLLVSGTNLKTVNEQSLLGEGNLTVSASTTVTVVTKTADYQLVADDTNKVLVCSAALTLTLPSPTGFPEGFNCVLWNIAATAVDVTLAGTYSATGTKIGQFCAASVLLTNGVWYVAGGLS